MKKSLMALTLAASMTALLAGCGGSTASTTAPAAGGDSAANSAETTAAAAAADAGGESAAAADAGGDSAAAPAASGDLSVQLVMSVRDEFRSAVEQAITQEAEARGIKFVSQDANNDTGKMLQYIESSRNAGDNAVIINLIDSATGQACLDAAGDMKVVFVNIAPNDLGILNDNACMVASDNLEAGTRQGEFIAKYFKDKGKTDIKYLMLQGTLGLIHTEERSQGVVDAMKANGLNATEASAPIVADYDRATAMDLISPLLDTTEFDCIIANNDAMALGAIEALKNKGMNPADYCIVGVDCTADGATAVQNGEMSMTVYQDPRGQGSGSLIAISNMLDGKPINEGTNYKLADDNNHVMWVPFETVTKDNVAEFMGK